MKILPFSLENSKSTDNWYEIEVLTIENKEMLKNRISISNHITNPIYVVDLRP